MNIFSRSASGLLGASLLAFATAASWSAPVRTGVLDCNVEAGIGFVIGSGKDVSCVYRPPRGRPEYYTGAVSRIGLDIGITGPGKLAWAVVTAPQAPYALAGDYAGPGLGLVVGTGISANSLVGGNGGSVTLQPLTTGGEVNGLNLSAGIGALSLRPVAVATARHMRRANAQSGGI